ncbi:hypothetical protein PIB30_005497 [Stylosanthes scabra]|uniref:Uncharacterized protein n=1 Tax=Stylosanthes scabra TaxID=79078 RepID=A0ABU6Z0V9_9FABA|nr:hypothetical protein [Stylosanthes scabra]
MKNANVAVTGPNNPLQGPAWIRSQLQNDAVKLLCVRTTPSSSIPTKLNQNLSSSSALQILRITFKPRSQVQAQAQSSSSIIIQLQVQGNTIFEKLGAIGTSSNLLVYLTTVFNLENITATNIINIFNGSTNFATIIRAFCLVAIKH